MTAPLAELIARLEAAPAGSSGLDRCIAVAVGWDMYTHKPQTNYDSEWVEWIPPGGRPGYGRRIPEYTASLDAAVSLWETPQLDRDFPRRGINLFYSVQPGGKLHWAALAWEWKDGASVIIQHGAALHPIRSMSACIAALKARAAGEPQR